MLRSSRKLLVAGVAGLAAGFFVQSAAAVPGDLEGARLRHRERVAFADLAKASGPVRDAVLSPGRRVASLPATLGPPRTYYTPDGFSVDVAVSDLYDEDPAADQAMVDFLGTLLHGSELGDLAVGVYTPDELSDECGEDALACYYPFRETMYIAGESTGGVALEQVIAHEYGHHIATNRDNAPWPAFAYGPKRWATAMRICPLARAKKVFPGAEDRRHYALNPGEGWAEAYRAWNASRADWDRVGWNVVARLFFPDTRALGAVERDVAQPWTKATLKTYSGTLAARGARKLRLPAAADGRAAATVRGAGVRVSFVGADGKVLTQPGTHVSRTVCGERFVTARITAKRRARYTLVLSLP